MYRLYDQLSSGNGYKARLMLHHLGLPFERIEVNTLDGSTRTPAFLAMNPVGKIPVLELPDGTYLRESNAILYYLAEDTPLWPADLLHRAQTLQWMFFEQHRHEPTVAEVRSWVKYDRVPAGNMALVEQKRSDGYAALQVMEDHLADRGFLVGDTLTIADLALYAYTHVAHEGGFDMARFRAVDAWMERVRTLPGYVPITQD